MCLAIPGKIISLDSAGPLLMGEVDFSGVLKTICLAYTPEAKVGDFVIVHVGFSINILDQKKARDLIHAIRR